MRVRDRVIYVEHPRLYGEMEVHWVRRDGMIVCLVDPDSELPGFEVFEPHELAAAVSAAA